MRAVSGGAGRPSKQRRLQPKARTCWRARSPPPSATDRAPSPTAFAHLAANAGGVREFLSTATWRVLNGLDAERSVLSVITDNSDPFLVTECLDRIMVDLAALAGLVMESMVRGPGLAVPRSRSATGACRAAARCDRGERSATLPATTSPSPCTTSCSGASESLVAYRRRYRSDVRLDADRGPAGARRHQPAIARVPTRSCQRAPRRAAVEPRRVEASSVPRCRCSRPARRGPGLAGQTRARCPRSVAGADPRADAGVVHPPGASWCSVVTADAIPRSPHHRVSLQRAGDQRPHRRSPPAAPDTDANGDQLGGHDRFPTPTTPTSTSTRSGTTCRIAPSNRSTISSWSPGSTRSI